MKGVFFLTLLALLVSAQAEPAVTAKRPQPWGETLPVPAGQKVEVRFTARATGPMTLEANSRIRIQQQLRTSASHVVLQFPGNPPVQLPVLSQSDREITCELYVPAGAETVKVSLQPAPGAELTVANLSITPAPKGAPINLHPTFREGDLNPYGFQSGGGGGFYQRPDGVTVWNTGFAGNTPSFPIEGGREYTATCQGIAYSGRRSHLRLQLFKGEDHRAFHEITLKLNGIPQTFQIPAEATRAELLGYDVILESCHLTPSSSTP